MSNRYQVAVIGSGSGGREATLLAARKGIGSADGCIAKTGLGSLSGLLSTCRRLAGNSETDNLRFQTGTHLLFSVVNLRERMAGG